MTATRWLLLILLIPWLPASARELPVGAVKQLGGAGDKRFRTGAPMQYAQLSPDGKLAFLSVHGRGVMIVDLTAGRLVHQKEGAKPFVARGFALSPDGKVLVSLTSGKEIELYDVEKRKVLHTLRPEHKPDTVAFSPDSKKLAVGEYVGPKEGQVSLWDVTEGERIRSIRVPVTFAIFATFSPDGDRMAVHGNFTPSPPGEEHPRARVLHIFDVESGKELRTYKLDNTKARIQGVAFSPDEKQIVIVPFRAPMEIRDAKTGEVLKRLSHPFTHPRGLRFSPKGDYLVGHDLYGTTQVWETKTWTSKGSFGGRSWWVTDFVFHDGKALGIGISGSAVEVRDLLTGGKPTPGEGHEHVMQAARFLSQRSLLTGDVSGHLILWDLDADKPLSEWRLAERIGGASDPRHRFPSLAFSEGGKYVAGYHRDAKQVLVWSLLTKQKVSSVPGAKHGMGRIVAFSPEGEVASLLFDLTDPEGPGTLQIRDAKTGKEVRTFELPKPDSATAKRFGLAHMTFSPDGSLVALAIQFNDSGTVGTEVFVWDVKTGRRSVSSLFENSGVPSLAFSPDNAVLALGGPKSGIVLLHPLTGEEFRCEGIDRSLDALAFSPDGRMIAGTTSHPRDNVAKILVWERRTRKIRTSFAGHTGKIDVLAFSPDSSRLASAGRDSLIYLWDMSGSNQVAKDKAPSEKELWETLSAKNPKEAFRAMSRMVAVPEEGLALLKKQLSPDRIKILGPEGIRKLIKRLDANEFRKREQATEELEKLGTAALPELTKAVKGEVSLEVHVRIARILRAIENADRDPAVLCELRAVEVLERIGNEEAHSLLSALAKGEPGSPLTEAARAALERMPSP